MEALREDGAALALVQHEEAVVDSVETSRPAPFITPEWWDSLSIASESHISGRAVLRGIVKDFVLGEFTKKKVMISNGRWEFSSRNEGSELWLFKNNPSVKVRVMIAKKINGVFIGNSSSLAFQKLPKWKSPKAITSQHEFSIQRILSEVMPMVPFGLFKEAQLDINTFEIVEKGPTEKLELGRKVKGKEVLTHYTGSMVFRMMFNKRSKELRGDSQYFLFDIDRNDLKLKNLNFFLSRLSGPAKSIADAYASLKPAEVYEAERFLGREIQRQGEWFFIPVKGDSAKSRERGWSDGRARDAEAVLESKGNRPHYVEKLSVDGYVKGKVTHGGFEHKPIHLDGWHKPVPNTAVESFKISGAVD